jgi:predicted HAD superfamily phosphohydrolase YqeG
MLNIEIHYNSKKPFKKEYNKVLKKYKKEESAFIGDQIMTDVMGAKRNGLFVIFIDKISENESFGTKILRFFEGFVLRKYNKKNILVKGCYYD